MICNIFGRHRQILLHCRTMVIRKLCWNRSKGQATLIWRIWCLYCIVSCSHILYYIVLSCVLKCHVILHHVVSCRIVLYHIVFCSIALYCIVLCCISLYRAIPNSNMLYCMCCITLMCIVSHCVVKYMVSCCFYDIVLCYFILYALDLRGIKEGSGGWMCSYYENTITNHFT